MNAIAAKVKFEKRKSQQEEDERLNKYFRRNLRGQTAQFLRGFSPDFASMILWTYAEYLEQQKGVEPSKEEILQFGRAIQSNWDKLVEYYEMDGDEEQTP